MRHINRSSVTDDTPKESNDISPLNDWICSIYAFVEDKVYALNSDSEEAVYLVNVCCGSSEMLTVPYGTWTWADAVQTDIN